MDINLEISRDIVKALVSSFNGDGRLAAVAFQKISAEILKYKDNEIKALARDIVVEMGPQFGGGVDMACEAFERIYSSINMVKRNQSVTED